MEPELLDARATRLDDAVVAVVLLAGFVFEAAWVVPVVAVSAGLGTVFGLRGAPVVRGYHVLLGPRLEPPTTLVNPTEWRFAVALETGALFLATMLLLGGLAPLAWVVALVVAVSGALDATTGISVAGWAYRRFTRR